MRVENVENPYIRDGTLLTPVTWGWIRDHENWYAYDGHVRIGDEILHIYVLPNN